MDNQQIMVRQIQYLAQRAAQLEIDKGELIAKVEYYERLEQQRKQEEKAPVTSPEIVDTEHSA